MTVLSYSISSLKIDLAMTRKFIKDGRKKTTTPDTWNQGVANSLWSESRANVAAGENTPHGAAWPSGGWPRSRGH